MKLLLDEDPDVKLRFRFGPRHEVSTVQQMGWLGKKNGELLRLMLSSGFEALLTGDQNLPYRQNWQQYPFAVVVLSGTPRKVRYSFAAAAPSTGATGAAGAGRRGTRSGGSTAITLQCSAAGKREESSRSPAAEPLGNAR
ncbi:hypothetical protein HNP98_003566 [Hymenobacter sp. 9A]|uniref:VapC45 PIN like domain-containing protein n=1 Tax=Hymenobacter caeli TaxID=2735894 RepID=A0ABX2FUR6_9BACT|nr:hypothetical protein [Hymenobacter caeli]NRT20722.1 hypothetical protein [Hymenobacter caeli]